MGRPLLGHCGEVPLPETGAGRLRRKRHASALWTSQQATFARPARALPGARRGRTLPRPLARADVKSCSALAPGPPTSAPGVRGGMREEDVPTEQPEAEEDARLPDPDAHPRRPGGHRPSARQGSLQSLSLIWRVRDRTMFRALMHGRRRRSGPLQVSAALVSTRPDPPRIAFAVGRSVGNAVVRNRVRRRLRAAVREHATLLRPGWAYLVHAGPASVAATYGELSEALCTTLQAHSREIS